MSYGLTLPGSHNFSSLVLFVITHWTSRRGGYHLPMQTSPSVYSLRELRLHLWQDSQSFLSPAHVRAAAHPKLVGGSRGAAGGQSRPQNAVACSRLQSDLVPALPRSESAWGGGMCACHEGRHRTAPETVR